ncbi:hypothetical protein RJ639_019668 [Escallonia herrerae]|uniref:Uncharacterized protein n=1 Tax=Escallonia herrerae TaxID=1293975 RepID=A0AA88V9J2_9ASTE|nr:hypothetical protein RJ639_019668 [Escallonia herrerae]
MEANPIQVAKDRGERAQGTRASGHQLITVTNGEKREINLRQWLYDASLSGNVETVDELMREDELTLARVSLTCFNETPLRVAAMLGHANFANFAKALVSYKPDLASQLDSQGCSALHLAASNGFVGIVKTLLKVDSDVCLVRDKDRRTHLHLAVMKGHVRVVKELARARWEVSQLTLERGETILHSCVISNRLEVLKSLMELTSKVDDDFVNVKDVNGNTILHT